MRFQGLDEELLGEILILPVQYLEIDVGDQTRAVAYKAKGCDSRS